MYKAGAPGSKAEQASREREREARRGSAFGQAIRVKKPHARIVHHLASEAVLSSECGSMAASDGHAGGRRPSGEPADDYVGGRRPSGEPADEIDRVLSEIVAPLIRADGGELWIVSRDDTQLVLHLGGRYSGCPGNTLARRRIIEPAIQSVAPRLQVTVTSGTLVPPGASRVPS